MQPEPFMLPPGAQMMGPRMSDEDMKKMQDEQRRAGALQYALSFHGIGTFLLSAVAASETNGGYTGTVNVDMDVDKLIADAAAIEKYLSSGK